MENKSHVPNHQPAIVIANNSNCTKYGGLLQMLPTSFRLLVARFAIAGQILAKLQLQGGSNPQCDRLAGKSPVA